MHFLGVERSVDRLTLSRSTQHRPLALRRLVVWAIYGSQMTRRGAPPSRQRQAFESLLDPAYASQPDTSDTQSGQGKRGRQRHRSDRQILDKRGSDNIPGFTLREATPTSQQPASGLEQLSSMFGSLFDSSIISEVLKSCDTSVQAAAETLLEMSAHQQPKEPQQAQLANTASE